MNNSLIQQFFQVPIYIRFLGSEETAVKKKKKTNRNLWDD